MFRDIEKLILAVILKTIDRYRRGNPIQKSHAVANILVSQIFHIGDVVLTTPALEDLKDAFPNARITFLLSSASMPVLFHNPYVDEKIVFRDTENKSWRGLLSVLEAYRRLHKTKFDLSVHFDRDAKPIILSSLMGVPERLGFNHRHLTKGHCLYRFEFLLTKSMRDSDYSKLHRSDGQRKLLEMVNCKPTQTRYPKVYLSEMESEFAKQFFLANHIGGDDDIVLIHPGARLASKKWPLRNFIHLAKALVIPAKRRMVICLGPEEADQRREIEAFLGNQAVVLEHCSLLQYAAVVKRARLFVGNDSGPMHIAAAMGTPCVITFLPTEEKLFAPYWVETYCVASTSTFEGSISGAIEKITVAAVLDGCERLLSGFTN